MAIIGPTTNNILFLLKGENISFEKSLIASLNG